MKALVLTSNGLRHQYFASTMSRHFDVVGVVSEPKRNYYTKQKEESAVIRKHFDSLAEAEKKYFGDASFPQVPLIELEKAQINEPEVVDRAISLQPDLILLFGTAILRSSWLNAFTDRIINLHLGLSPYYRGSATLFWPIFNGEIECVGTTIHLATDKVDAGSIIARIKPTLSVGDSYYDINYRAIKAGIDQMPGAIKGFLAGDHAAVPQTMSDKKAYKKSDFTEEALLEALSFVGAGLTKEQLDAAERSSKCACSS